MAFGAGTLFVQRNGGELVDPRPFLAGSLRATLQQYPHLGREIPAMGYSEQQIADLAASVDAVPADVVVDGSPADLGRVLRCNKPIINVRHELDDTSARRLVAALDAVRVF
jgi:predicted GTPase